MRLSFDHLVFGVGDAFGEYLSLADVITSDYVMVSNDDQSWDLDVT